MTASRGIGRGGRRPGAGRKKKISAADPPMFDRGAQKKDTPQSAESLVKLPDFADKAVANNALFKYPSDGVVGPDLMECHQPTFAKGGGFRVLTVVLPIKKVEVDIDRDVVALGSERAEQLRREHEAFKLLNREPPSNLDEYEKLMQPLRLTGMDPVEAAREVLRRQKR